METYKISNRTIRISKQRVIFLIGLSFLFTVSMIFGDDKTITTFLLSWISNILFLVRLNDTKCVNGTLLNQYSFFLVICFFYLFGKAFLYSVGLISIKDIVGEYDVKAVNECLLFSVPSFYFFTLSLKYYTNKAHSVHYVEEDTTTELIIKVVAIIMFIISVPIYCENAVAFVTTAHTSGYFAYFMEGGSSNNLFENLNILFVPSVMLLIVISKNKIIKITLLVLMLVPAGAFLFSGSRGAAVALLVPLMYLWFSEISTSYKKGRQLIFVFLMGIVLLGLFSTLRQVRDNSLGTPSEIINIFFESNPFEGVVSTINEVGSSMYILILVKNIVPTISGFVYGYSYLAAFLACIPSSIIGYSFANDAALDVWLTKKMGASYGLGFSVFGEAFYNWGYLGIILVFFVGLFIFYFLSGKLGSTINEKYSRAIVATSLYIFTHTARNSLALSVRNVFYGIILPMVLIIVIRNLLQKSKKVRKVT